MSVAYAMHATMCDSVPFLWSSLTNCMMGVSNTTGVIFKVSYDLASEFGENGVEEGFNKEGQHRSYVTGWGVLNRLGSKVFSNYTFVKHQ